MSTSEVLKWREPGDGASSPPRVSAAGYFFFTLICLVLSLVGPTLVVVSILSDEFPWFTTLIGAVLTLFLGFCSFVWWRSHRQGRRDTKVLDAAGYPAIAEILSVRSKAWAEQDGYEVGLRVSGRGFEPFETTLAWKRNGTFTVGGQLAVLVEPTARLYEVRV